MISPNEFYQIEVKGVVQFSTADKSKMIGVLRNSVAIMCVRFPDEEDNIFKDYALFRVNNVNGKLIRTNETFNFDG